MDKFIRYALGAAAMIVGLSVFNIIFDNGQITWVSNVGITILIVTAWVMVDRYTAKKDAELARKMAKTKKKKKH